MHDAEALQERYGVDARTARLLSEFGFDPDLFDRLRAEFIDRSARDGSPAVAAANRVRGDIEPPRDSDLVRLPPIGSAERSRLDRAGREAIAAGYVGVLVLAGGMATRFGGGVKALAEVIGSLSFADVKIADLRRLASELDCAIPLVLMSSFQTDSALRGWAASAGADARVPVTLAQQGISMRLGTDGELFRDRHGVVSLHAPGHGDAPWALRRSGVLAQFARGGGRHLFVTNVDNAAATLDPAIIGAHLDSRRPLTCEVVPGHAVGGAPWRVDGRLQIVEAFRLPPTADPLATGVTNTNSLVADLQVWEADWPLTWLEVRKVADGAEVVQFERLIGELSASVDTTMLLVDRDGTDGRFQPAKDPDELAARRPEIARILASRGITVSG